MKPSEVAAYDQAAVFLGDSMPVFWRRLYNNCIKEGFTEEQSLKLVQAWILSQSIGGVRGV